MKDQLQQVEVRIAFADMNYRIYRIYTEPRDRAKYLEVLTKYPSFFWTSREANLLATIVTLYALYETRRGSISLTRLVRSASDDKLRAELQPILDEATDIWRKKITILRNEVYAHLFDNDLRAKFLEANLLPNEIERLIELSKQLVNKLSYAHDHSRFAFGLEPASDTYNLLDRLSKKEG